MNKINEISNDEIATFDLPQNYSILLHKFEQMALKNLVNLSTNHNNNFDDIFLNDSSEEVSLPIPAGRAPPPRISELEYAKVVDDIVIGVILTMLVISVIFFICSCFIYHKFQEWKNSYRSTHTETGDVFRYDVDVESLPSYTIVSGLPTYDDALEEFRKSGIILSTPITVIKIFEDEIKEKSSINECNSDTNTTPTTDNNSVNSICTCGAIPTNTNNNISSISNAVGITSNRPITRTSQIIELSPQQLQVLSRKRLSLQIAFNSSIRRNSRPRIDLYREANRNNHLRSRGTALPFSSTLPSNERLPKIHRSTSTMSLENDQNLIENSQIRYPHRGSLT